MKNEGENRDFAWFTARVQFFVFIMAIVVNATWSYFGIYKTVEMNAYRIEQIEKDRAERWTEQAYIVKDQIECINDIKITLAEIKADIKYIKNSK